MSNYQRAESRRAKLERNLLAGIGQRRSAGRSLHALESRRHAAPLGKTEKDLAEASPDQVAIS